MYHLLSVKSTCEAFPGHAEAIDVQLYTGATLPDFPPGLRYLYIQCCSNLTELPALPEGLEALTISGFTKMTEMPKLPASLRQLRVNRFRMA